MDLGMNKWDKAIPVEKSSYLQDEGIEFINEENFRLESGKLPMLDLFCGAGGFVVGCEWAGFQSVLGIDYLEPAQNET